MATSICALLRAAFPSLTQEQRTLAFQFCLLYVCRMDDANTFRRNMRMFDSERVQEFKQFRLRLTESYYAVVEFRYCAMWAILHPTHVIDRQQFQLRPADAKRLEDCRRSRKLRQRVIAHLEENFGGRNILRPEAVRRMCGEYMAKIDKSLDQIVASKLRFVSVFNRSDLRDLKADLVTRVVQQFYWSFKLRDPTYQKQYLLMIAHNAVRNMAYYWTTSKRRTSSEQDSAGISTRLLVSENENESTSIATANIAAQGADHSVALDAQRIVVMYGTTNRRRRLLAVLAGIEDREFTQWLIANRLAKQGQTNCEVQDLMDPQTFLMAAVQWAKVNRKNLMRFVHTLRREQHECHRTYP